jgi:phosphonopyruvate decarboxylase
MTLYQELKSKGHNFFIGVPCSHLKDFIAELQQDTLHPYIPVSREDVAMGIAAGACMTGKKPVVFLQNSGLGHLINIVSSLIKPYQFPPIHLVVSVRTKPFEHEFMAKITKKLLRLMEYEEFVTLV